ncbi:MAG: hypothetical protein ACXU9C_01620 [Xanthobacteraceae bacterium]
MSEEIVLILGGLAAFALMRKKQAVAAASTTPLPTSNNVNSQLWNNVLGSAWKNLIEPSAKNAFLERNYFGQIVTSDGRPVDSVYGAIPDAMSGGVDTTEASDGVDYLSEMGW